jgi:hypothetical protein
MGSHFYSLPLLGPEKSKRERTASGVWRKQSIGESSLDVNSVQTCPRITFRMDFLIKIMMVRKKGLEPLRPFGHQLLRLARLPIPPLPRRQTV